MFKFLRNKSKPLKQPFQLGHLIEILQDGVCITKVDGEIIYLNRAGYSLLGIENNHDLSEINFFDACVQETMKIDYLKQHLNLQGKVQNYEMQLQKLTGSVLDVIITSNVIVDFSQQTIGFLFLIKDMTELKKIQQQLLQSQKLESVGLMASGIAHDFNNILSAIIPNAELIRLSSKKTDANYKRAEIIEKSAHRASDIAQRLLTFTRHEDHAFSEAVNLNQIVKDSLELLEHGVPKKIKIQTSLEETLYLINGDSSQLQQIIMNLVINAIDAMPEGGEIHLTTENYQITSFYQVGSLDPGQYVRLTVKDTGVGIPLENIPKIFDPFFTTKDMGKGTGLGLSVVYGIVKSLHGHIDVSSQPGRGTRFDLYFPASAAPIKKETTPEEKSLQPDELTILIVDDEDYVLNILADILDYLGYKVVKHNTGQSAIDYFRVHKDEIHYAIVDLKMPRMDGRTTSAKLREIKPDVRIIFTSGFDDGPMGEEDMAGVVGFLKKPYSINQLSKSLTEIIKNNSNF
ncbi:MAG: hypothetical protein Kow0042_28890 [Calditrichia bacterium]